MITGAHVMIFSKDEAADRLPARRARRALRGRGRRAADLQAAPAELGVHDHEANDVHKLYFICDDLDAAIAELAGKGVSCDLPSAASWGRSTAVPLPGGGKLGLYEATHARP